MADLEVPPTAESVFLALDDEVNVHRPVLTGDVFAPVVVPVLGDEEQTVVVVGHPCSMRKNGTELADLLVVAPVLPWHESGEVVWRRHFKVFPLDTLPGITRPVARLDRATLVPSSDLQEAGRTACLSRSGINLLRQRLVHQLTRVVIGTWVFDEEAAGTYEEIDLLEEWSEAAAGAGLDGAAAATAFDGWIRESDGDRTRQEQLADPQTVASVRRAAIAEMSHRYRR